MSSLYATKSILANLQHSLSSNPPLIGSGFEEAFARLAHLGLREKAQESRANELADSVRESFIMKFKERSEELTEKK